MSDAELIASLRKQLKSRDEQVMDMAKDIQKLRTIEAALLAALPEFGKASMGAEDSAVIALIEFARSKARRVKELEMALRKAKVSV